MRKKLKEYSRRFLSVFLCISLLFVFVVFPVSAVDVTTPLNLLDYLDTNEYLLDYSDTFNLPLPITTDVHYLDIIVYCYYYPIVSAQCEDVNLTVVDLGNYLFRIYGKTDFISGRSNISLTLTRSNVASGRTISFVKFDIYSSNYTSYSLDATFSGYNPSSFSGSFNGSTVGFPATVLSSDNYEVDSYKQFTLHISPDSTWKDYDFLSLSFNIMGLTINSISADVRGQNILDSVSYIGSDFVYNDSVYSNTDENRVFWTTQDTTYYIQLMLDLTDVDKSSGYSPKITITGTYEAQSNQPYFGYFYTLYGYVTNEQLDPQVFWFRKLISNLGNWFSINFDWLIAISSKLDLIVGGDSAVYEAKQKQEEINVSVNNQLVGAVEDWNTNIEVVETGYDMAFSKTTPALNWLASLADGIFNGMGWFGNVYFLVGLISVIMLVLSKSGLAHKIGSISRKKGD